MGSFPKVVSRPDHENSIFFSWAAMGIEGGVTKYQTDSQCGDQTTTWLVTDAGLRGTYCTSVTFLNFRLNHNASLWVEASYPQSVVFAAFGLWRLHPRCGTVSDLPQRRWDAAVMRGPRCILGSSLHIFQHFHSKCETLKLGTGNNYSHWCRAAPHWGKHGSHLFSLFLGQTNCGLNHVCIFVQNSNILIHNPSVQVPCGAEVGRRQDWQAKQKDFPHWV